MGQILPARLVASPQNAFGSLKDDPGFRNADARIRDGQLKFRFQVLKPEPDRVDAVRMQEPGRFAIELGDGTEVRLAGMVTRYATGPDSAVVGSFGPDGAPRAKNWPSDWLEHQPGEFSIAFLFEIPDGAESSDFSLAFNPATYQSWRTRVEPVGDFLAVTCRSYAWTDTSLTLAFDLRYGDPGMAEIPFEIGARAVLPNLDFGILAIEPGTWQFNFPVQDVMDCRRVNEAGTLLRLRVGSRLTWDPTFRTRFLGPDGKPTGVIRSGGAGFELNNRFYSLTSSPDQVSAIRISTPPAIEDRLVFQIAQIPGMPAENRGVANWFDCRLPYLEIGDERQFRTVLREGAQVRMFSKDAGFLISPAEFPLTYRDVSMHRLLADWNRLSAGPNLDVEPTHFVLLPRRRWGPEEIWERISDWLGL